jgi:hypothetical protein
MKIFYKQIIFLLVILLTSCSSSDEEYYGEEYPIEGQTEDGFEDGTYCAEVEYYNPNTGTNSTYTLEVEVEYNEVTKIYFGNGGWMDDDHFSPEELDSDGSCSFTSDMGYEYTITIIGRDCGSTDASTFEDDRTSEQEEYTCPRCGDEKEDYDDYCSSCEDEVYNTCSQCGGWDYGVNGGVCDGCREQEY